MKILSREERWIHTHFLTDCTSLSDARMREIVKEVTPYLRELGIVYSIHFTQVRDERACRIVLECIPFTATLDRIQRKLQDIIRDIPARPAVTKTVRDERSKAALVSAR